MFYDDDDDEDEDFEEDEQDFEQLLSIFQKVINEEQTYFFSSDDIIRIVDYYMNYKKDQNIANKAIEIGILYHPKEPYILLKQAELLFRQNKLDEALIFMNTITPILEANQLNHKLHFFKATIYYRMCRLEQALNEYKMALNYDPNDSESLLQIYNCYDHWKKYTEAIEYFSQFIDEHPFNPYGWVCMANCHFELKDLENALECVEFAETIEPDDDLVISTKADILKEMNKLEEAIDFLHEVAESNPGRADLITLIGEFYNKISEHEKAIQYLHKSLYISSHDPAIWLELAKAYLNLNQDKEALSCIQHAIKIDTVTPEELTIGSDLLIQLELWEDALDVLKQLYNTGYRTTEILVLISIALEKSGYPSEAVALLSDEIYNKQNKEVELQYCLASILLLYQYRQEGLNTLEKALQIDPSKYPIIYKFNLLFQDDMEIQELIQQYLN